MLRTGWGGGNSKNESMKKQITVLTLCTTLFAFYLPVVAQQRTKIPRIGFLTGSSLSTTSARIEAFQRGLRELGYVEGKNIVIDWRFWEGKQDRQRALAAELARLKVDVIVAVGAGDIRAAKQATATIPIVMISGGDAVGSGLVSS